MLHSGAGSRAHRPPRALPTRPPIGGTAGPFGGEVHGHEAVSFLKTELSLFTFFILPIYDLK